MIKGNQQRYGCLAASLSLHEAKLFQKVCGFLNIVVILQKNKHLADKVRSGVIDQIGTQSRGTQSCNFYVVKHTDMPATLVEVAFISNPEEEKLLNSDDGAQKAAQGIADGIADYFG